MEIFIDGDLKELLKDIIPGYIYGEQKVEKSLLRENLKKRFGGAFGFKCIAYNNNHYLSEITLFYNFTYKEAKDINNQENCTEDIYVEFIEYESRQEQDKDLYKYYDMYYFTILWLPTSCLGKVEECKKRIEQLPVKNNFTLHGLWPSYQNGSETHWCNVDNDIEIEIKDEELLDFMNKYYPGSYLSNEFIWGHEYNMHGYCYNQRNGFETNEYEYYFNKIKELYEQFNLGNMLVELYGDNIKGNKEINRNEIQDYLENKKFNKDTYLLVCTNITQDDINEIKPHLLEIRIRFDLDFKLLKNETDASEFDCPQKFYVYFLDKSDDIS